MKLASLAHEDSEPDAVVANQTVSEGAPRVEPAVSEGAPRVELAVSEGVPGDGPPVSEGPSDDEPGTAEAAPADEPVGSGRPGDGEPVGGRRWDDELVPDEAGRTDRPEADCPVEVALAAISGRWTTLVLRELMGGPLSFSDLGDALPQLSDKVLDERLRRLRGQGLIERRVTEGFPNRVTYTLTPSGVRLRPLLIELYRTGRRLQAGRPA
jgi:DNA-binding HxlR family transcriptional regulator